MVFISELRLFLGAIHFYIFPLDELFKTDIKWHCSETYRKCFLKLKEILSSNFLLAHYDPTKSIIVAADGSIYGLGACIPHEYAAICHASRSLTPAGKSNSQC